MNHLSPDELVDALDGMLAGSRQAHVSSCAACAAELRQLQAVLRDTQGVSAPEPSPLFWDHFSSRVHAAIAAEEAPRVSRWPLWLRVPVLAPLAAMAILVVTLASVVSRPPAVSSPSGEAAAVAGNDLATFGADEWAVVSEIVGPVDLEDASAAGIVIRPGDAERAALQLTVAEQRELLRLLKQEIDKAGD